MTSEWLIKQFKRIEENRELINKVREAAEKDTMLALTREQVVALDKLLPKPPMPPVELAEAIEEDQRFDKTEGGVVDALSEVLGRPSSTIIREHELRMDLGVDDMDYAELITYLENYFYFTLPAEETTEVVTVNDLFNLVKSLQVLSSD